MERSLLEVSGLGPLGFRVMRLKYETFLVSSTSKDLGAH